LTSSLRILADLVFTDLYNFPYSVFSSFHRYLTVQQILSRLSRSFQFSISLIVPQAASAIIYPTIIMLNPLLASALLAMSSSGAIAASNASSWTWNVVNWGAGCAHRGCFYDFNIKAPANGDIPAFSAYCSGDEDRSKIQTFFKPCGVNDNGLGNRGVAAKFVPRDDINYGNIKQIAVSFSYTDISSGRRANSEKL
jgi:hypothetical protein